MVGDKGPGYSAAGNGLHHGCFHFQEPLAVQKAAGGPDNLAPGLKDFSHLRVDNQVKVALPVTQVHIFQAMPLFRQGPQRLGQDNKALSRNGDFTHPGFKDIAVDSDDVAQIQFAEEFVGFFTHIVGTHVNLNSAAGVLDVGKGGLAHAPPGHDPAGNDYGLVFQFLKTV